MPILSDRPFFENLNVNASVRYTDYESYGSDKTYKVAGEWELFQGFGIRGSYGTSYRAPALAEQFLGATSGFLGARQRSMRRDNFPVIRRIIRPNQLIRPPIAPRSGSTCRLRAEQRYNHVHPWRRRDSACEAETSTNWSVGAVVRPRTRIRSGVQRRGRLFRHQGEERRFGPGAGTILNRCYSDVASIPNGGLLPLRHPRCATTS